MCMHCSQMCDKCKPADVKAFTCSVCGKATILSRTDCLYALGYWKTPKKDAGSEQTFCCRHCGTDLTEVIRQTVRPKACVYSGITCGYPCRRNERVRKPNDKPCRKQVVVRDTGASSAKPPLN